AQELKDQPRLARVFKYIMMDGANELLRSEMRGIWLDVDRLKKRTPEMAEKLADIERRIMKAAGLSLEPHKKRIHPEHSDWPVDAKGKPRTPNFNASIFARWMLFDHLGLDVIKRGKPKPDGRPGDPSMAEDVLLELEKQ